MKELVSKMVETEREDWDSMVPPEADVDGKYYTTIGITLYQMIEQNVRLYSLYGVGSYDIVPFVFVFRFLHLLLLG